MTTSVSSALQSRRMRPLSLCTGNAGMIAANFRHRAGQRDAPDMDALPNWMLA